MITAVNSQLPGPTIHVHEGDTVAVHVLNNSPYNLTIHWYVYQTNHVLHCYLAISKLFIFFSHHLYYIGV